jgi:HSP20 family molecular chaperone IbpA
MPETLPVRKGETIFGFPRKIDPERVRAEFRNGVLYVTAEIAEEAKAKKVRIEAA